MNHELYMHRCLELAQLGAGNVAPNPMVGAVLVHEGRIIGEGYHQRFGEAHAEVHCIAQAVHSGHTALFPRSTLYVSLEPCAHFGKTPPCVDLIIKHGIPKVVIGCTDPSVQVAGKGIEKLLRAGIEVKPGVLESECQELNRRFFTFHTKHRPYIILKWAQTSDGFIAAFNPAAAQRIAAVVPMGRLLISNEISNRLVHKWRSEEAAILVGTNTVIYDDPELTTRLWPGNSPVRLIIDMDLQLPASSKVFNGAASTIVFNRKTHSEESEWLNRPAYPGKSGGVRYYQLAEDSSLVQQLMIALHRLEIQSVMLEGGATLLQSFIDEDCWDEARTITNRQLAIGNGLPAPRLKNAAKTGEQSLLSDLIQTYRRVSPASITPITGQ
jgi:diaminohydroxyphosphoribosylaminopyrimidine deaminase/5-amino-6-(5-phosphoribosylamino)uracil reductase